MSLLSTDITKVKKLPLKEIELPTPERKAEPILIEKPPTDEEIIYSKLVSITPLLEELVELLDLVSMETGERIKKVEAIRSQDRDKLRAIAQRVIEVDNIYTKEDIIARIKEATSVNQKRAESGFNLMLKIGGIGALSGNRYFLVTSSKT